MKEFKEMVFEKIIDEPAGFVIGVAATSLSVMLCSGISGIIVQIAILITE